MQLENYQNNCNEMQNNYRKSNKDSKKHKAPKRCSSCDLMTPNHHKEHICLVEK